MGTVEAVKLRPGVLIGRYRIVRVTRKTYGDVCVEARDEQSHDMAALKFVKTTLEEADARTCLEDLGASLGKIDNPHVVPVRDIGIAGAWGYQRFAPFTAGILAVGLDAGDKFSASEVLRIANDVATGLQALHEAGVAHGDISPENILLARQNRARIYAPGLLAALRPPGSEDESDMRPPHPYTAPERTRHGASPAADLYSLGLVLYELFTGRQAAATVAGYSPGERDSLTPRPPSRFRDVAPHLPRPLEILTFSLLQSRPEDRCRSAAEFRARIRQIIKAAQRRTTPPKGS